MVLLVGLIVVIGILAVAGSLLWKKANRLDPASKPDAVRFFVQNQLGAIVTVAAAAIGVDWNPPSTMQYTAEASQVTSNRDEISTRATAEPIELEVAQPYCRVAKLHQFVLAVIAVFEMSLETGVLVWINGSHGEGANQGMHVDGH